MDKNAIKKYAVWARRELLTRVRQRAALYGVAAGAKADPGADSVEGRPLSPVEKRQRQSLLRRVAAKGFDQVMEEAAYTWFNRFAALRFMEVNNYLPSHVRPFTNEAGEFKPEILAEAATLELEGLDKAKVYALAAANQTEELFKYLLIAQCNALNGILPGMFERIGDYTELLLPDHLLREGSVVARLVADVPEADWADQVQIIGWLYQYYNSEPKDEVFAALKRNVKISKENIPAATQLFTPDWIVHYMVENSLGRLWLEGHPSPALRAQWKYYLDEAEQAPEVAAQLAAIRKGYAALKPEDIRAIDPCTGSGHILCVLFDVLVQIYESYGYTAQEAAAKIVECNLWGLDVDERAAQLSYFAVMMKGRQYDRRFFSRGARPHICAVPEWDGAAGAGWSPELQTLCARFRDGKEYGSLIAVPEMDWAALRGEVERLAAPEGGLAFDAASAEALSALRAMVEVGEALAQKYHAVVTNPPYMGGSGMDAKLSRFVRDNYPDSKSDTSTAFMEACMRLCQKHGYMSMINIPVWMFLSSYEKLRDKLLKNNTLINMVHPGRGIFGSDFGSTTFVFKKGHAPQYKGTYRRLFDTSVEVKTPEVRERQFFEGKGQFVAQQDNFAKIPGAPVAYWVSEALYKAFSVFPKMSEYGNAVEGIKTGDNDLYLRYWHEVERTREMLAPQEDSNSRWRAMTKGGDFRRWYGNLEYVVAWGENGSILFTAPGSSLSNSSLFGTPALTWTYLTSGSFSMRVVDDYILHNNKGPACYINSDHSDLIWFLLGLCNSKVVQVILNIIAPTIDCKPGNIANIPIGVIEVDKVGSLAKHCQTLSRNDWDSFETSWDFQRHPLLPPLAGSPGATAAEGNGHD